jgi:hypothetical protein
VERPAAAATAAAVSTSYVGVEGHGMAAGLGERQQGGINSSTNSSMNSSKNSSKNSREHVVYGCRCDRLAVLSAIN